MKDPGILLQRLTRCHGTTTALDSVDLSIKPGLLHCVLGRNGAGKTTMMEVIGGLGMPTRGDAFLGGVSVRSAAARRVRRSLGYLAQTPALYEHLTGREFLLFVAELYHVPLFRFDRLDEGLAALEMRDAADTVIRTYSAGMRKKIAWLAAVLHEPHFLVLDEPFVALDAVSVRQVRETMIRFRDAGRVVLFSTHTMEIAERFADRLTILHRGRVRFDGTFEELRSIHGRGAEETLETLFIRLTEGQLDVSLVHP